MALRIVLRWGLMIGALGWTAYQLPPLVRSASAEAGVLRELHWGWVVAAALLGLAAVALYAELHRELLAVGGARPPAATIQLITFAQNAIGNTVPVVGGAGALAYAVTGLRRRGVDAALATWTVLFAGALSVLCLLVLGAGALTTTGGITLAGAALAVVLVAAAVAAAWMLVTHPAVLRGASGRLLGLWRRLPRSGSAGGGDRAVEVRPLADRAAARLCLLRPSARQWLQLLVVSALTWLLDFANLAVAAAAVPGSLLWSALVQGFLVVQASIAVQVLPGGAGLAELGMLGALLGSGVAAGPATAVVLIYRTSSWLLPSALGWLTYGLQLQLIGRRPLASPVLAAEPQHVHHPGRCMPAEGLRTGRCGCPPRPGVMGSRSQRSCDDHSLQQRPNGPSPIWVAAGTATAGGANHDLGIRTASGGCRRS